MRKKIILKCRDLYFELPSIKYDSYGSWEYYMEVLDIYIDPSDEETIRPKNIKPWIWNASTYVASILLFFLKMNKRILREEYDKHKEETL